MPKILVYTSPARGHVYPLVPTLAELARRGHHVAVCTLSTEVSRLRGLGFSAQAIAPAIEAREIDDWKAKSPPGALAAACRTFVERGQHEVGDLRAAIDREQPDLLLTDINAWGAGALAEASGLPWATYAPYFLPLRAKGIPPWGMGLAPMSGTLGHLRDAALWTAVNALYDRALKDLNALRKSAGVEPLRHVADFAARAPCVVAYTAEPFEYARDWPSNVHLVGPGIWEPSEHAKVPDTFATERPLVLVTCSTEYQNDGALIETALAALAEEPVRVVATTASLDPALFRAPANAQVERYLPHGPLLKHAACVVCHGGMGITQKALSLGVPVCVVPFGRDQLEVARHVEVANAGTRLPPSKLSPARLAQAVRKAMTMKAGAQRVAQGMAKAGGAVAAAGILERLAKASPSPVAAFAKSA